MRTTVTLEPDVEALVRKLMADRAMTFKQAVNHAIRTGLVPDGERRPFQTPTFHMGPGHSGLIDKALRESGELEDQEAARKLAMRK